RGAGPADRSGRRQRKRDQQDGLGPAVERGGREAGASAGDAQPGPKRIQGGRLQLARLHLLQMVPVGGVAASSGLPDTFEIPAARGTGRCGTEGLSEERAAERSEEHTSELQ